MTAQLVVIVAAIVAAAVITWLCTRGYYRAAYGDRYQRGYSDGQEAQIRAYTDARAYLPPWEKPRMLPAPLAPQPVPDAYSDAEAIRVTGSWRPAAGGPPSYAQLSPEQLDSGPPTSEWARDLIAGVEAWNAEYLPGRDVA